jgi:nuclear pore complex protein Nup133
MQSPSVLEVRTLLCSYYPRITEFRATDNEYQDRLELKSNSDRTLGVGVIEAESAVLVLTAATMMKAYVDMDRVAEFDPE